MNTIKQTVVQYNLDGVPQRMIVQYTNDQSEDTQVIINYDSLTAEEKATFDALQKMDSPRLVAARRGIRVADVFGRTKDEKELEEDTAE